MSEAKTRTFILILPEKFLQGFFSFLWKLFSWWIWTYVSEIFEGLENEPPDRNEKNFLLFFGGTKFRHRSFRCWHALFCRGPIKGCYFWQQDGRAFDKDRLWLQIPVSLAPSSAIMLFLLYQIYRLWGNKCYFASYRSVFLLISHHILLSLA